MAPVRRHPQSPSGADDISHLTLKEVQDRLARNERVLSTIFFTPSPPPSLSSSPTTTITQALATSARPLTATAGGADFSTSPPGGDPTRDKLLGVRQALLARQAELLQNQGQEDGDIKSEPMSPSKPLFSSTSASPNAGPSRSPILPQGRRVSNAASGLTARGNISGKARALDTIRAGETNLASNGVLLPIDQTFQLAERDFDNATAQTFANLTLFSSSTVVPGTPGRSAKAAGKSKHHGTDENARAQQLARMTAYMSYKSGEDDDDPDEIFMFDDGDGDGDYDGDGDRLVLNPGTRREKGTGEEVDEYGEDDEGWREGSDDYAGNGGVGDGPPAGMAGMR